MFEFLDFYSIFSFFVSEFCRFLLYNSYLPELLLQWWSWNVGRPRSWQPYFISLRLGQIHVEKLLPDAGSRNQSILKENDLLFFVGKFFILMLLSSSVKRRKRKKKSVVLLMFWCTFLYINHVTRKPVFGRLDQVRLKPACSATEAS